jgi:hypothetical protein
MKGICINVNLTAWFVIIMERAFDMVILIYFNAIMRQNLRYRQPVFDVGDLHLKKYLKFLFDTLFGTKIHYKIFHADFIRFYITF